MKCLMLACGCASALAAAAASPARAQGSVEISGLIDGGVAYVANINGRNGTSSALQEKTGDVNVSRWVMSGQEPLGHDLRALFLLANGFSITNGAAGQQGRLFGFQSYAGMASGSFGTLTAGRQFDSMLQLVQPFALGGTPYGGVAFAHPYDNDDLANYTRTNNSLKYTSPDFGGFRFGYTYGFSNAAGGFDNSRGYSAAASYRNGPFAIGASYLQFDNESNSPAANTNGAEPAGAPFNAGRQRTFGLGSLYASGKVRVAAIVTETRLNDATSINNVADTPVALAGDSIVFQNVEVSFRYALTPRLSVATAYTFTLGTFDTPKGRYRPKWHQLGVIGMYALSPRTDTYVEGIYQRADDLDGTGLPGAQISNFSAASGPNQLVVTVGVRHKF
ncbi:general bacterial porin, GBP family [Burkholderia multivorans]